MWSKTDRLAVRESGTARIASSVEKELIPYVARTFRRFLDSGINIRVGDIDVSPHDPLYLMKTTRFHRENPDEPTGNLPVDETFEWPVPVDPNRTAPVRVRISLLPEKWRLRAKDTDRPGGTSEARDRKIPDNEGISILRADREIFYDYLRDVQPSIAKIKIDRWWGCEISFSPELDECFKVRNVKKGAEPFNGLRDKLKELIFKTVENLRQQIRVTWGKTEAHEHQTAGVHSEAEEIAAKTEARSPKPRAGQDVSEKERDEKIRDAAKILTQENPDRQESVEDQIRRRPFTVVAASWPGSEIFEIEHLGSNVIVKLNMRHPFYQAVYRPLLDRLDAMSADSHSEEERELARLTQTGLDLLILSYARAEGMHANGSEHYSDLRTQWGMYLKNMVQEWKSLA